MQTFGWGLNDLEQQTQYHVLLRDMVELLQVYVAHMDQLGKLLLPLPGPWKGPCNMRGSMITSLLQQPYQGS